MKEITKEPVHPISIGQVWAPADPRLAVAPHVEVVAIGEPRRHFFPRNRVALVQDISIRNMATGRTSKARSDRFNDKKDGYFIVREPAA
jgi:hypothetical protein